jgi:uncharacterized membrane protein
MVDEKYGKKKKAVRQKIKSVLNIDKTWSDRFALFITNLFGSVLFLNLCILLFSVWIIWNLSLIPSVKAFDKFPFPALNMGVSLFAIILSISVLISQNREGKIEKLRQQVEFEVNVRAEHEITKILQMLHAIKKKMGIDTHDSELEAMKEVTDLQELQRQIDNVEVVPESNN